MFCKLLPCGRECNLITAIASKYPTFAIEYWQVREMKRSELEQAILNTLEAIAKLKKEIEQADPQEARRLWRRLKELQYLQIWQMETLERLSK